MHSSYYYLHAPDIDVFIGKGKGVSKDGGIHGSNFVVHSFYSTAASVYNT